MDEPKPEYRRPHFGKGMNGKTPMAVLKKLYPGVHPAIGAMPVIVLDRVAEFILSSFKLERLPWDAPQKKSRILNETMAQYKRRYATQLLLNSEK